MTKEAKPIDDITKARIKAELGDAASKIQQVTTKVITTQITDDLVSKTSTIRQHFEATLAKHGLLDDPFVVTAPSSIITCACLIARESGDRDETFLVTTLEHMYKIVGPTISFPLPTEVLTKDNETGYVISRLIHHAFLEIVDRVARVKIKTEPIDEPKWREDGYEICRLLVLMNWHLSIAFM